MMQSGMTRSGTNSRSFLREGLNQVEADKTDTIRLICDELKWYVIDIANPIAGSSLLLNSMS